MKFFYDELFFTEGNSFQDYPVVWLAFRSIIINGLFESIRKLERYMIMDVPTDILEEVTEVTALVVRNGMRVDWMDETFDRIAAKRKQLELLVKIQTLEDKLIELDHRRDKITQTLAEADAELLYNNLSHRELQIIL